MLYVFFFNAEKHISLIQCVKALADIIPVKCIIQFTISDFCRFNLFIDLLYDPVRKINPAGLNPDDHEIPETKMVFEELMTQSLDSKAEFFFGQNRLQSEYFYKNNECHHASAKKGYSYPVGGSKVSLIVRALSHR